MVREVLVMEISKCISNCKYLGGKAKLLENNEELNSRGWQESSDRLCLGVSSGRSSPMFV